MSTLVIESWQSVAARVANDGRPIPLVTSGVMDDYCLCLLCDGRGSQPLDYPVSRADGSRDICGSISFGHVHCRCTQMAGNRMGC